MNAPDETKPRVEMQGVSRAFPGVRALEKVDFKLYPGEVHALLGENGAGKSTLIKVLTGAVAHDEGRILLDGHPVDIHSTGEAHALGISAVFQEVNLVPTMSVTKNMTLGRQPRNHGLISWGTARALTRKRLARLNVDINVEKPLGFYSVAIQQLVAIARALEDNTRVLILDEPTASLDANETALLFKIVRDLKAQGIAIVFISHFIDQVYEISDRITVLRNGHVVGSAPTAETPRLKLISLMLGRELGHADAVREHRDVAAKAPILVAEGLGRRRTIEPVDLSVKPGETMGLSGLLGSGRTETVKLIFGALRPDQGRLAIDGHAVAHNSPAQALRLGIAFCPEDRKAEGLVGELTIRENIMLALQSKRGWMRQLSADEQRRLADEMIRALAIATPDAEKPVGQLSGGNQQKVVLARALVASPRILILDEPTRGIDVGAHADIVKLIRELCDRGLAIIVASSELDELVAVSDRIAVLRDRRKVGEIAGAEITRENIIHMIAGT